MLIKNKKYLNIIGIMSGSSIDGLDVALCQFFHKQNHLHYSIIKANTLSYPEKILNILQNIRNTNAKDFFEYDVIYGQWIGKKIHQWLKQNDLHTDAIAVHGHTVFHYPEKGFSVQLGNPYQIAQICSVPVIYNFRNADIALGGQGAPLVPIGDKLLFSEYDACVNIGGIANVFIQQNNIAFDICIANMALNYFAQQLNHPYDKNGLLAQKGQLHPSLFKKINALSFFSKKPPKSLNREYFESTYLPLIQSFSNLSVYDILHTITEHIAFQIARSVNKSFINKILITGGGALNNYLIHRIKSHLPEKNIIIPDKTTIKFKEALIFALLGYLRLNNLYGNIKEATGATKNTFCGEIVYL